MKKVKEVKFSKKQFSFGYLEKCQDFHRHSVFIKPGWFQYHLGSPWKSQTHSFMPS